MPMDGIKVRGRQDLGRTPEFTSVHREITDLRDSKLGAPEV